MAGNSVENTVSIVAMILTTAALLTDALEKNSTLMMTLDGDEF